MRNAAILHAIMTIVLPALCAMGYTHMLAPEPATTKSMRTYYVDHNGHVSSRKPQTYCKTVRGQSVAHVRKMLAV